MYVVESEGHKVKKVDTSGLLMTVAGFNSPISLTPLEQNGDGGPPTAATFNLPHGVFVDSTGIVFIADVNNNKVRKLYEGSPTYSPTETPSMTPTIVPSVQPTMPTSQPTLQPSGQPSRQPSSQPSGQPSMQPSGQPSRQPLCQPSCQPTRQPTSQPSGQPLEQPSGQPLSQPSSQPTGQPIGQPTGQPSVQPIARPSGRPSSQPSMRPSKQPTSQPSRQPSLQPAVSPSTHPSRQPTGQPSVQPFARPSVWPTKQPLCVPTVQPSENPSSQPTAQPSRQPSCQPTGQPSEHPSVQPFARPSVWPTKQPLCVPTVQPSENPSSQPTAQPLIQPSRQPSGEPSAQPSSVPSIKPTGQPTHQSKVYPSTAPTIQPWNRPSSQPTTWPSSQPTEKPSGQPSNDPTSTPTKQPASSPLSQPSMLPSTQPFDLPTLQPSSVPSCQPSETPTSQSSMSPFTQPSAQPSMQPSCQPETSLSSQPTIIPFDSPSGQPTTQPSSAATKSAPSSQPSTIPSTPSCLQTMLPSKQPSMLPTSTPTSAPFSMPSCQPSRGPTSLPLMSPFTQPSSQPSMQPSMRPSCQPGSCPSSQPILIPSNSPSRQPTTLPSGTPTTLPSVLPTSCPTSQPSTVPSLQPSIKPTLIPSTWPTSQPYGTPSTSPSTQPSVTPSQQPTSVPSTQPSSAPSCYPSNSPSQQPNAWPTRHPSTQPITTPSRQPSSQPTHHQLHPTVKPLRPGESSMPTFKSMQPSVSPTQLPRVSVNYSSGIVSEFKIILPYMFTDPVSGNGRYDIKVTDATSGRGNLIFGSKSSTATARVGSSSLNMFPIISYDYTARSVSNAGDVNGDGYDDLIIGVPYASRCHVLFGNENGFVNMTEGFTITGSKQSDLFGWSVASAGDVNNDSFADFIIGAPNGGGEGSVGMAYILYGRRVWSDMDISELADGDGFSVYGVMTQESLGISVSSAGDINGDGYDDVIIGALDMNSFFSGAIYVVFGQASMSHSTYSLRELTDSIGFAIEGPPWSWFGYSVSGVGDVNGDGVDDMLIGSAPRKMVVETPVSYIIFGTNGSFPISIESLSYAQGVRLTGGGIVVSSVGDVNGDGCDDILLGSDILFEGAGYVLAKPHMFPMLSADPTTLPTFSPSSDPTHVPSQTPSVKPTAPTITPSVSPTGPTFSPSLTPTQPTSVPTVRPTAPSQVPSVVPTVAPSLWPSLSPTVQPSVSPSCKPSLGPTVMQTLTPTTRSPSYKPTIVVTLPPTNNPVARPSAMPIMVESPGTANITYNIIIVENGGIVSRTQNSTHYFVNSTVDVVIEGTDGYAKFTIIPNANTSLTIEHFKPASDLIDLEAFVALRTFTELVVSTGVGWHSRHLLDEQYTSLIILLPMGQSILIGNMTVEQISSKNFIFSRNTHEVPAIGTMKRSYGPLIVLCSVFGSIGLYLVYMFGEYLLDCLHIRRIKARVTDWTSDNVRNNPTYVSFNINDSDKSIFSDISSDSEDDGDMDSSIEISSESQESVAHDTVQATTQVKSGLIQSKDSSASSDLQTQHSVNERLSSSDHGRINGHGMYGIQHPAYSTKDDDSIDYMEFEGEGCSDYKSNMHSSEEADTEVGRMKSHYHSSEKESVHNSLQYAHPQLYHNTEALYYLWSEENQPWDESFKELFQYHQQQQQQHQHEECVDNETGLQEHAIEYDLEANYSH